MIGSCRPAFIEIAEGCATGWSRAGYTSETREDVHSINRLEASIIYLHSNLGKPSRMISLGGEERLSVLSEVVMYLRATKSVY